MDSFLVQRRAPIRVMVRKLRARAEHAIADDSPMVAEGILASLTDKIQQLRILDKEIFDNWNKDDDKDGSLLDKEVGQVMDYDIDANVTIGQLKTFLSKCEHSHTSSVEPSNASVRLPKIDLPKFGGCKLEWSSFWEIFEVSIHKNPDLAAVQKFSYLISCLTGEAKAAVSGLGLSGENYTEAVKILSVRFGDKTEVTREHFRCLQKLKRVSDTTDQLQRFCDDIHIHSRNLSKVGILTSDYEVMLVPQLMAKLPDRVQWSLLLRANLEGSSISNLEYFLFLLETEIKVRNSIQSDEAPLKKEVHLPANRIPAATALSAGAKTETKAGPRQNASINLRQCPFCDEDHNPTACPVTDVRTRIQIIRRKGLCFRCLARGHVKSQCRSPKACSRCFKKHHVSICNQTIQNPSREDRGSGNPEMTNDVSLLIRSSSSVVMPTAKAILHSPDSTKEMAVRILFDSGSNKTFIRQDVCNQLGIESIAKHKLLVNTFGKDISEEHECGAVRFSIRKPDGQDLFELNGFTVASICGTQMSAALGQFPHFNGLDLADSVDIRDPSPEEISILVGADQFYDFVLGEVRRGGYGPAAISSKLGWMACGPLSLADDSKSSHMDDSLTTHVSILHCDSVLKELHKFWDLEHIGITGNEEIPPFLSLPIKMVDGRYETPLPWKDDKQTLKLPSNFGLASRRLRSTLRYLKSQPDLVDKYQEIIDDQLQQGVLETVPDDSSNETVHYLPHSPVIRPTAESTKIRIVLDASAKLQGRPSLNDCLQTGTNDLPQVASLACGFRFSPIAILADIEKAFIQISIPPVESFEKLVILDAHNTVCHGGVSATLAKIRDKFWLLKGRQKVNKVLNRCVSCKSAQGLPFACPQQPTIPDFRLSTNRAFATVGIDYCGPLYVSIRKGEENCKAYIILFTCASTRALHLEVVTNLTTRSFLLALKRFVSRRGIPNVVTDNASTFKSAATMIDRDQVQSFAAQRTIKWNFTTQYAPWRGGFYERMIKDVKLALKKVLNKQSLTLEELTTVTCEIEAALNSRPLTYVGEENVEALTPSHFLVLQRLTKPGNGQDCALEVALPNIKLVKARLHAFWDQWKRDYVASLRERSSSGVNTNRGTPEVPKVGDVCLLTEKTPRLQWRLVRIISLCPGRDGLVRSVIVRLANGREVKRPVSLLVPVERA